VAGYGKTPSCRANNGDTADYADYADFFQTSVSVYTASAQWISQDEISSEFAPQAGAQRKMEMPSALWRQRAKKSALNRSDRKSICVICG
jgi:hypothetical protein